MAANVGKLANRYARALYQATVRELGEDGMPTPAQRLAVDLDRFRHAWDNEHEFSQAMLNPMFDKSERESALIHVAKMWDLPDIAQRFLSVVFQRERISAISEIIQAFTDVADEAATVVHVDLTVARAVSQEEKEDTEGNLRSRLRGNLSFNWKVDPEILGGMLISYQGKVLDSSVRGRLNQVERHLLGSYS